MQKSHVYTLRANAKLGLTFVTEFERVAHVLANPLPGKEFRHAKAGQK